MKVRLLSALRARAGERGFTFLEVVIALAVSGLVVSTLAGALSLALVQVPKQGAKLAIEGQHQLARYWVARDANSAEQYTVGTSPTYGTFTWRDFSGESTVTYEAAYYYDSALKALMRQEKMTSAVQDTFQVATGILQQSDVSFAWSAGQRKVTVSITSTVLEAVAVGDQSRAATLVAFLRYEAEGPVSPPSDVPVPTPVPGTVTYYVAANPTLLAGTYVSGNAASFQNSDTDYYVASSTSGNPKEVIYEVFSQNMTAPAPIGQVEVRYVGQSDRNNVAMEFFVKVGSGSIYDAVADYGFTFTQPDTETTRFFYLDATKLAALNGASTKVLYLKVRSSASANHDLRSNQALFIASP